MAHTTELENGATRSWRVPRTGYLLEVERGQVWATVDGVREDWAVSAGEALLVRGPGRLVVQALEASELVVRVAGRVTVARGLDVQRGRRAA